MNQDQARRWAEEVDVLKIIRDYIEAYKAAHGRAAPNMICEDHLAAVCREAIAAALVKLTRGQEPVASYFKDEGVVKFIPNKALPKTGEEWWSLYTHPAPSRQEDRKPLTDEQIGMLPIKRAWSYFKPREKRSLVRAIEAAHNIREQQ